MPATATPRAQELYADYQNVRELIHRLAPNLPGYEVDCCPMSGSVMITRNGASDELAAYATPWWEGECSLPFAVNNSNGEIVLLEGKPWLDLDIHYTGDFDLDARAWAEAVRPMLKATIGVPQ